MEDTPSMLKALLLSHAVIFVFEFLARRFTSLPSVGSSGIYVILLAVCMNTFGEQLPPAMLMAMVVVGLLQLLWVLRRRIVKT